MQVEPKSTRDRNRVKKFLKCCAAQTRTGYRAVNRLVPARVPSTWHWLGLRLDKRYLAHLDQAIDEVEDITWLPVGATQPES